MGSRSRTAMNEVFQRAREAGRAGIERCLCPTGKDRGFVFVFFSSSPLLSWMLRVGGEGALWSSTGSRQVGALPEPASSYPEADHMPFAPSECACRRKKTRGDKSVPGLCIRIHEFILYTKKRCVPQSVLCCAFRHLWKEREIKQGIRNSSLWGEEHNFTIVL